ncbi:MAG: helix-turn-helix transcriptional regulator [Candidatus Limnocylindrales bacterium]
MQFEMGREIRDARLSAGVTLRTAAGRVGFSHTQLRRLELGKIERLTVDHLSRGCAAVGLQLLIRAMPGAGPALDAGQLALIGRLRSILPSAIAVRTEVPLLIPGDRRAWDAVLDLAPDPTPLEAESRLRDIQSLGRRSALKLRDSEFNRMILLVSDTANNRRLLDEFREELRASFPLDTRAVLRLLRQGETPPASGIVVL